MTLTKLEHIELVTQANYWKSCHHRATLRLRWAELEHRRALDQAALREAALRCELEVAQAKIRDLQQRVFGRSKGANESQSSASGRPRGHQRGKPGQGRRMHPHLPARVEVVELASATCPHFLQVAIAQRIGCVPTDTHQNHVNWKSHSFGSQHRVSYPS